MNNSLPHPSQLALTVPLLVPMPQPDATEQYQWKGVAPCVAAFYRVVLRQD